MTEPQQQPEHLDRGEATFRRTLVDELTRVEKELDAYEKGGNFSPNAPSVSDVLTHAAVLAGGRAPARIYGPLAARVAQLRARYDALVAHG